MRTGSNRLVLGSHSGGASLPASASQCRNGGALEADVSSEAGAAPSGYPGNVSTLAASAQSLTTSIDRPKIRTLGKVAFLSVSFW